MRTLGSLFVLVAVLCGGEQKAAIEAVDDVQAKDAIKQFDTSFKTRDMDQKQGAVYALHDVPSDLVIKKLARLLKNRKTEVKVVAAMALGGQGHNVDKAGNTLHKSFKSDYDNEDVLSSVLDGWAELHYMEYWPALKKCLDDNRNAIAIRALDLIAANKDWRAVDVILKMYKEAVPKGYKWTTGVVTVDTGAAGTADAEAAKAKWTAKYGAGGSKAKAKAKGKAGAGKERNLATQLRRTVEALTGEDFETSLDFEDWLVENWVDVARKRAKLEGKDPNAAARAAALELPALKRKIEEEREKLEKQAEDARKQREKKKKR